MKTLTRLAWPTVLLASALIWAGCQTSGWTGTVTLTKIVRAAADEYAKIYNDGLVPPDIHAKVSAAYLTYRKAAGVAADAITAWKLDPTKDYIPALDAAKSAALGFVELLTPFVTQQRTIQIKAQITKATSP